jgi:hypothetical protein
LISPRDRLAGIEYNFLRKAEPDDRPRDAEGYYTNKPIKADYLAALAAGAPRSVLHQPLEKMNMEQLAEIAKHHGVPVLGARSKKQPPPLFVRYPVHRTARERNSQLVRLQAEGLHMMAIRDGVLPVLKNPTRDCSWCPFFEMCELHEAGGNWEDYRRGEFQVEDPYTDHR